MQKGGAFLIPSRTPADTFTTADLDEDQVAFKESVGSFVRERLLPREVIQRIENHEAGFMRSLLVQSEREVGILSAGIATEYGGAGVGEIMACLAGAEIGREQSFATAVLASNGIGTEPLKLFGTQAQRAKYLPRLASAEWIAMFALTEAGAGSDVGAVATKARWDDVRNGWILNGTKRFTTNGDIADLGTIFTHREGAADRKLTGFLVERSFGFTTGKAEDKLGIRGSGTTEINLDDVFVPADNVIGEVDRGYPISLTVLNSGRLKLGAACIGGGRQCYEEATEYASVRKQFGTPISSFGLVQSKLALMAARIFMMESIVFRTAWLIEQAMEKATTHEERLEAAEEYALECSAVKVACAEAAWWIADENVQVHGGAGYCKDYNAERYLRNARIARIYEGTDEINRLSILRPFADMSRQLGDPWLFVPHTNGSGPAGRLLGTVNGAKQAVILAVYAATKAVGRKNLLDNQVVAGMICDSLMDLYALDSMAAAVAKHPTRHALACAKLMFDEMLPVLSHRVDKLFDECPRVALTTAERTIAHQYERRMTKSRSALVRNVLESK